MSDNDTALRVYNEVLGLNRLHYGMWLPGDEISIQKLRIAQERYEDYIVKNIPDTVKTILDVGCGTGAMTRVLLESGYEVEGLSPDKNQKKIFAQQFDVKFHHTKFDDFLADRKYDCLIMSESSQYINMEKLFRNAKQALEPEGYLIVCDYFLLNNTTGVFKKSGHNYEDFMKKAKETDFTLIFENDITNDIVKTLDIAKDYVEKTALAIKIITEKFRQKRLFFTRALMWLFRKKIKKYDSEIQLLDSEKFKQNKTYRFMVFRL